MTPDCKKLWRKTVLRGIGAFFFGWSVVTACVVLLSIYGVSPEITSVTATQSLPFPENEQMLNAAAAQLAREGAALSKVEPAAGKNH